MYSVPEHSVDILNAQSFDNSGNISRNDISFVQLNWSSPSLDKYNIPGYTIPKNYTLTRRSNLSSTFDYSKTINYQDISYNDTESPIDNVIPVPRVYTYTLTTEYEN